jgi:hypothetical protein
VSLLSKIIVFLPTLTVLIVLKTQNIMGKKLLTALALIAVLSASAQSSKREEGIKLGLKGGLNVANMNGDVENNVIRTSLHLGFISEIIISDKWSFQPELMYSGQGFRSEDPANFSKVKYDYVILPLLAKHYVADRISIEAGPQVGFLVNSFQRDNSGNTDIDDQNIVDFGVDLGATYELRSGVFFSGRYNLGITNVNGAANSDTVKLTNSVFQFSVGVLF